MSIALIASFVIKEDAADAFEKAAGELVDAVNAGEPGVRLYRLARSQAEPTHYRMLEIYDDADALAAHGQTEWFKRLGPSLGACLAAKPVIEKFDLLGD